MQVVSPLQTSIDVASLAPNAEITVYPWKEPEELRQRTIDRMRRFLKAHIPMRAAAQSRGSGNPSTKTGPRRRRTVGFLWISARAGESPAEAIAAELYTASAPDLVMLVVAGRQLRQALG